MNRTVKEHITQLEQRLIFLNTRIMEENNQAKRNMLEAELRAVESALALYHAALETESRLSPL